jgi:hypothetical protein
MPCLASLIDRYLDQTARRKQHNTTVIESYNAFNMKFEEGDGGHGQGGVLGGDDVRKPLEPTSSPPPKKMASKPTTPMTGAGGKQRAPAKAKSPVRSPPKQAPRGPRALAADKRRREAEAAVWGRSRMEQEKQLRGMTALCVFQPPPPPRVHRPVPSPIAPQHHTRFSCLAHSPGSPFVCCAQLRDDC